jgi:hypothetical protein
VQALQNRIRNQRRGGYQHDHRNHADAHFDAQRVRSQLALNQPWVGGIAGGPNLDPETYLKAIDTKDFLRLVITGHLYIEAVLIQLIKKRSPQNAAGVDDLRFMALVDRSVTAGLVQADERETYNRLNRMRNKLAHELGTIITMGDVEDFLKTMSLQQLNLVSALTGKPIAWGIDLQPALLVLFVDLHSRMSAA